MPIKYVPFVPEPMEGQAVLGNFNRILRYKGADEVTMTLQRGIPLYEMLNSKKTFKPIEISEDSLEMIEFLSLDCTAAEGEWHFDSEIKIDKLDYVIRNSQKTKTFRDGTIQSDKQPLRLKIRNICGDETIWEV